MLTTLRWQTILCLRASAQLSNKYAHTGSMVPTTDTSKESFSVIDTRSFPNEEIVDVTFEKKSPLEECTEDISYVAPYLKPTFNFAAYINQSETLQQLLKLGVDFYSLEKKRNFPAFIMGLDFEKDIKNYILFFHDRGLAPTDIADTLTKNPYILQEDIDNLKVRINYLMYKKFNEEMILRILLRNPFWLMFSTKRIDTRLGFFQNTYKLTGDEVRMVTCKQPKLITYSIKKIKLNQFALREEMGFSELEIKDILLKKPKTFMRDKERLLKTYDYIINTMKIPLEIVTKWPEVLTCREVRLKHRHLFLQTLGRAQYNPKLPNYISLLTLVSGEDGTFAVDIAKSSLQAFNAFLKTL